MNKDKLETLKQEVADRFSELNKKKEDIVTEMTCLQGEHRLLVKLINEEQDGTERNQPKESTIKSKVAPHRKGTQPTK